MKLIRAGKNKLQFALHLEEKALLLHVLGLYPLVPPTHHRLSQGGDLKNQTEDQLLLEESLTAQHQENRRQIEALMNDPRRFTTTENGGRVSFSRSEIEWLLQVCNDVRVGSWLALGAPDEKSLPEQELNEQTVPHLLIMDAAGFFEMQFLQALHKESPGRHE